ncbi:LuxR C-terminal-related transcriptional regulator [Mucilaginibacter sabulilitoris]|uniref:LuxR C-terminal-related transcriptional regulator n=1 Tax=Mucilaginibacter sabulilitoris TaxID=1173583 RepID=A0ABZ0TR60_9SPHI|nr:LuxR C-terminal-related transcriptional regulator [Mucilaginibacter sabulilitoris]WPU95625.1 LuxR C-terminal-related transcriptional regulator [Mucilaginibacter sabulilitoris]
MLVFGTQVHIVTFIFIILEFILFCFQFIFFVSRPQDKTRKWHLILLGLMLLYNITGGLFPDPKFNIISVSVQLMIAYGAGFVMASYFPFYFYKAFELSEIRWHALYGVPLFLMLPYVVFFVIIYALNGDLKADIIYGIIMPFMYAVILLYVMFRAVWRKRKSQHSRGQRFEALAMYFAISPLVSLAVLGFVEKSQLAEVLCSNTGVLVISILFIWKSVQRSRLEYNQFMEMKVNGIRPELFVTNCLKYHLTGREIEIIQLLRSGMKSKQIGDRLFIAERTVTTHLQNAMHKTQVKSRLELIRKLEAGIFDSIGSFNHL